jgi:hypothetical protein
MYGKHRQETPLGRIDANPHLLIWLAITATGLSVIAFLTTVFDIFTRVTRGPVALSFLLMPSIFGSILWAIVRGLRTRVILLAACICVFGMLAWIFLLWNLIR